jgi:hypothetical protein
MNELTDVLQGMKGLLGFKNTTIAVAYLGAPLACLVCVLYGLIRWNQGRRKYIPAVVDWVRTGTRSMLTRTRASIRGVRRQRRVPVGKRHRRRRGLFRLRISGR